ncbi:MAG: type II secretion system F family protein [Bdellovibrionales bacterium]
MPVFRYVALAPNGETQTGEIESVNEQSALGQVQKLGLLPISAKLGGAPWWARSTGDVFGKAIGAQDLALFTRQLARLLKAGLELDRALQMLGDLAETKAWKPVIRRVTDRVRRGEHLSDALAQEKTVFAGDYVSMVRAGEAGGALAPVLERLALFLQRRAAIGQRIFSALIYPALLLIMAVVAITIILTVVLPQFEPFFAEAKVAMPLPTRIVVAAGNAASHGWWLAPLLMLGSIAFLRHVNRKPGLALRRDKFLLGLPLLGPLLLRADVARLAHSLGSLMANGVMLAPAIAIAAGTMGNRFLQERIAGVALDMREGKGLAAPLARTGVFPPLMLQLVRIGEETGRLEEMLGEIAEIYESELQRAIDRLMALLVPALTTGMGVVIAFIVAAMLLAMLSVNELAM